MINSRIRINYYDQNDSFSQFLPREGQIIQQLTDEYGNNDWFLVNLDHPFEYQLKIGNSFQFKLIECNKFLIRSRWKDQKISLKAKEESVSIFILLIPDESKLSNMPIRLDDYIQIAWGICQLL